MPIHLQTSKKNSLLGAFRDAITELKWKKRAHRLMILSCYIDFEAIRKLIATVKNEVNLTEVLLAFEFMEAYRDRQPKSTIIELNELKTWCSKNDIIFSWNAVRYGALMHAKGYAVVQYAKEALIGGVVLIGSGNATKPGLGSAIKTNVELSHVSNNDNDIKGFIAAWDRLIKKNRSLDGVLQRADEYEFAYSMLASGVFLHDWQGNLRSQVGITYMLTQEGHKAISMNDELKQLGFDIDKATINRNPLEAVNFPYSRALPSGFTRKYTVDTILGRWCPLPVWDTVEETITQDTEFQKFFDSFRAATESDKFERIVASERARDNSLVNRGFVTSVPDRIDRWLDKIITLRDNEYKLSRIFMKFERFDLPYDYSEREAVEKLHDSVLESLNIKTTQSFVAKKIEMTEQTRDLSMLDLSDRERANLVEALLAGPREQPAE